MILMIAFQTATPSINQQIGMMLLEKLGVGVIVLSAVVVGQWIIERYKGRRAVWTEISKERVKHIAEDWTEMNKWDGIVGDLYVELQRILETRFERTGEKRLGCPELSETIAFLSTLDLSTVSRNLTDECKAELDPLIAQSMKQSDVVQRVLQANRFWLGKKLYEHCREFQKTLHDICMSFDTMDFPRLAVLAEELNERRQDVLTTLKLVK
jgi:hypothetical protein